MEERQILDLKCLKYMEEGAPVAMHPAVVGILNLCPLTSDDIVGSNLLIKLP